MTTRRRAVRGQALLDLIPSIREGVAAGEAWEAIAERLGVSRSTIAKHGGPSTAKPRPRRPHHATHGVIELMVAGMDEAAAAAQLGMDREVMRARWRRAYRRDRSLIEARRAARESAPKVPPPPKPPRVRTPKAKPPMPPPTAPVPPVSPPAPKPRQRRRPPALPSRAVQLAMIDEAIRRGIGRRYDFVGDAWRERPIGAGLGV